jgi:DNA polymerase III alpha subunit
MLTNSIEDLVTGVLNHGPEILSLCICQEDISKYLNRIQLEKLDYPVPPRSINAGTWFIPTQYQNLNIEQFLLEQCPPENISRLQQELSLYKSNNMIPVLTAMKYVVDTLLANNIVWGVGRGSSVSSYALHLLGVHMIDSVKYELPIEEFFKGE